MRIESQREPSTVHYILNRSNRGCMRHQWNQRRRAKGERRVDGQPAKLHDISRNHGQRHQDATQFFFLLFQETLDMAIHSTLQKLDSFTRVRHV